MINSERNLFYSLYHSFKVTLNTWADRILEICNKIIEGAYQLPWPAVQTGLEGMARVVGDLNRLFQEFPRRAAYKLSDVNLTIVYVGDVENIAEIQHLFYAGKDVVPQELGRIALWRLPAHRERWWAEGVDLVVGESSHISPYWPQTPLRFSVPGWVQQVLDLPDDLESLLSSRRMKDIRKSLTRAQKANFSWYFSQSKEDFDHFYYKMYVPYIKERHNSRARVSSYQDLWQEFVRGGLIVVTQNNTQVGGELSRIRDKTCFAIEGGVLDSNPDLLRGGIIVSRDWYTMDWAHRQGARIYDMGPTRPWLSNGVFYYKARWGAKATRLKSIYKVWTFLTRDPSLELQQHINQIGFISEIKGKFYATLLDTDRLSLPTSEIDKQLSTVQKQGLDGLLVVSANRRRIIPVVNSTTE